MLLGMVGFYVQLGLVQFKGLGPNYSRRADFEFLYSPILAMAALLYDQDRYKASIYDIANAIEAKLSEHDQIYFGRHVGTDMRRWPRPIPKNIWFNLDLVNHLKAEIWISTCQLEPGSLRILRNESLAALSGLEHMHGSKAWWPAACTTKCREDIKTACDSNLTLIEFNNHEVRIRALKR